MDAPDTLGSRLGVGGRWALGRTRRNGRQSGGVRTAALLGFDVPKEAFVATSTAVGLFVDGARMPVYLATEWRGIAHIWPLVLTATVAVIVGTALGTRVLGRLPQQLFRRVIAALLVALGLAMAIWGRG
ncbi:MAG TPA: TSUP family transporter [Gemmatimonadaceae bacterium]|nr:TSUP family transporter [Gemmatimonadaceae bacterium]